MRGVPKLLGLVLFCWCVVARAAANPTDVGRIVERSDYAVPRYDSTPALRKAVDADEYERAAKDSRFKLERLKYRSGGLTVHAYLYRPTKVEGRKLPAIIYNRGSWAVGDIGATLLPMFHRLGEEGFVVIAPLYRGSDGAEGHDEMGGPSSRI